MNPQSLDCRFIALPFPLYKPDERKTFKYHALVKLHNSVALQVPTGAVFTCINTGIIR